MKYNETQKLKRCVIQSHLKFQQALTFQCVLRETTISNLPDSNWALLAVH